MPSSYSLGAHFENFIQEQIATGRYASASEVIRAGLRMLEEWENGRELRAMTREQKLDWLRAEIQKGKDSGPGIPADEVMAEMRALAESRRQRADKIHAA
jgi:antitoxin ParD1/3/4